MIVILIFYHTTSSNLKINFEQFLFTAAPFGALLTYTKNIGIILIPIHAQLPDSPSANAPAQTQSHLP